MSKGIQALISLNAGFKQRANSLADEGIRLRQASENLTQELIAFSHSYWKLSEEAKNYDQDDDGEHTAELRRIITEVIGTENRSIHSRWRMIGACAPIFKAHVKSLPSSRDALYELTHTVSERNGSAKLSRWVETKKITPDTSVRDVSALRKKKPKVSSAEKQRLVTVTVMLDATYAEAAKIFMPLLDCKEVQRISGSSGSFRASLRVALGEEKYAECENKIG